MDQQLGGILAQRGMLDGARASQALLQCQASGKRLAQVLAEAGLVQPGALSAALAAQGMLAHCAACGAQWPLDEARLLQPAGVRCGCGAPLALGPAAGGPTHDSGLRHSLGQSPDPRAKPGERRCGRYVLRHELGSGGFGSVFRAWDPKYEREVAVKILLKVDERAKARFDEEVKATSRLHHPNIVPLLDRGVEKAHPFLVMQLVEGKTLEELAEPPKRLPIHQAVRIVRDVAMAIQYAHEQGVLHRDLKPANIIVQDDDHPRVVDFGLARLADRQAKLTQTGTAVGTPHYVAPEQAGAAELTAGADVYSLGGVLYYALTGHPPLEAESEAELWSSLFKRIPDPPSTHRQLPAALDAVCLKCLEKEPLDRYESARDLAEDLERFLNDEPVEALPEPEGLDPGKLLIALGLVAAVVLLLAAILFAWSRKRQEVPETPPDVAHETAPAPPETKTGEQAGSKTDGGLTIPAPGTTPPAGKLSTLWTYAGRGALGAPTVTHLETSLPLILVPSERGAVALSLAGGVAWRFGAPDAVVGPLQVLTSPDWARVVFKTAAEVVCLGSRGKKIWSQAVGRAPGRAVPAGGKWVLVPDARALRTFGGGGEARWTFAAEQVGTPRVLERRGQKHILVPSRGALSCISPQGGQKVWRRSLPGFTPDGRPPLVADNDRDGDPEIYLRRGQDTVCLRARDGVVARTLPGLWLSAAADISGDGPELVGSAGDRVVCLGAGLKGRWSVSLEGPRSIQVGDLTGDGRPDVVALGRDRLVGIASNGRLLFARRVGGSASGFALADCDGDGRAEVLLADTQGRLRCLTGPTSPLRKVIPRSIELKYLYKQQVFPAGPWVVALEAKHPFALRLGEEQLRPLSFVKGSSARGLPAWDAVNRRLLIPSNGKLHGWKPGESETELLSVKGMNTASTAGPLLFFTFGRRLRAIDMRRPERVRLKTFRLMGRIDAPPLPLDLDGNGEAEHLLVGSTASQVSLVDLRTEQRKVIGVPGPVRLPWLQLDPRLRGGAIRVVQVASDGRLTLLRVRAGRVERATTLKLDHAPACRPALLRDAQGRPRLILVATYNGWLYAVRPDLSGLAWANYLRGRFPRGGIALVDLDGDGQREIACAWYSASLSRSEVQVVRPSDGRVLLRLDPGPGVVRLAGGEEERLVSVGQEVRIWGSWPRLTPGRPTVYRALTNLGAGANEAVIREAQALKLPRMALLRVLARWRKGRPKPYRRPAQLAKARKFARLWCQTWLNGGERLAARRIAEPVGLRVAERKPITVTRLKTTALSGGAPRVEFETDPPGSRGLIVGVGAGGFRKQRKWIGLLLNPFGRLRLTFDLSRRLDAWLVLTQRSLMNFGVGFSAILVSIDGRQLTNWYEPDWFWYRDDRFRLGTLSKGRHTIEIKANGRTATPLSILKARLEVKVPAK